MSQESLAARCVQEVIDLHAFFQAWLRGELADGDEIFGRFLAATDPDFTLISPSGKASGLSEVAGWIRSEHGMRPGLLLWTDEHTIRWADETIVALTYREWQTPNSVATLRISTALFRRAPHAPNGVVWLHVHETWVERSAESQ